MSDHRVTESNCPECGELLDTAFDPTDTRKPQPGDFSVCAKCQGVTRFGDDMQLRKLTETDILDMPLPEIGRYQKALTGAQREN